MICSWCEWSEAAWPVVYEKDAFVVLAPGSERCTRDSLTLVPKAHTPMLTALSVDDMAAVLSGLSLLSHVVRTTCGFDGVGIKTHGANADGQDGHIHFHPVPTSNLQTARLGTDAEREIGQQVVLAVANAFAHSGDRLHQPF